MVCGLRIDTDVQLLFDYYFEKIIHLLSEFIQLKVIKY